jgi:methionine biosynthesis protein MetW
METTAYYDAYWSPEGHRPIGALADDLRLILEELISPGDACLDVGCGDGRTAGIWLSEHAAYTGVDISEPAVEMAQHLGLNVTLIDDGAELGFPDASFDKAVCFEVLEHLFAPHAAAREIARVLKPDGTLIVTVPNVSHWKARVDLAVRGRWNPRGDRLSVSEPWRDPHVRFFTPRSLSAMLEQAGFSTVAVGGRQSSILVNIPGLARYAHTDPGAWWRGLARRFPILGADLLAVAVR